MAGMNPLAQNLWDLARALDVLEAHPLVDPARIGMVGLSYGGTVTLFLAALDERVAAAVVSGYFSSWAESHKMPWNMCGSQVLPGMLGQLEHVDLGALVSPRALLVESGTHDDLFPYTVAAAGRRAPAGRVRVRRRSPSASSTTSSKACTNGTAPRPSRSSPDGSDPATRRESGDRCLSSVGRRVSRAVTSAPGPCCGRPRSRRAPIRRSLVSSSLPEYVR